MVEEAPYSKLKIEKITGLSDGKAASGIFSKRITFPDGSIGTVVSCIYVALKQSGDDEEANAQVYLSDIFGILSNKIEENEHLGVLEAIKEATEATRSYINDRKIEVSFAVCVFYKHVCYIGRFGNKVKISVFGDSKWGEINVEFGSGPIKEGQVYLIATNKFFEIFDKKVLSDGEDIRGLISRELEIEEVIDGLATEISSQDNQGEIGAAFVSIKTQEIKVEDDMEKPVVAGDVETAADDELKVEDSGDVEQTKVQEPDVTAVDSTAPIEDEISSERPKRPNILAAVFRELSRLKSGDIGAILRLRRNIIALAIVILLILGGSVFYTVWQNSQKESRLLFDNHIKIASEKLSEGEALIDLNRGRAREVLIEADREVKLALKIDGKNEDAQSLASKIGEKIKSTEEKATIKFEELADFGSSIVELAMTDKQLVAVAEDKVFKISKDGKNREEFEGRNLDAASYFDEKIFGLSGGVWKIDLVRETSERIVEGASGQDIAAFLGNIYLLKSDGIVKIVPFEGGYSEGSDYLASPESFNSNSRFAIDGSIWVSRDDSVVKFTRGEKEDFQISGLVDSNHKFGEIYTNANLDNIYVVDLNNSVLLSIDKEGVYKKAYQGEEFAKAKSVVVDEAGGKIYVAVDTKVLVSDL